MRKIALFAVLLTTITALFTNCSTEFDVYAEYEEIRVVYCVLNPDDSVQYIRIARAYQVEGDAIAYAGTTDLSMQNLNVTVEGNGVTYTAEPVTDIPKDSGGIFIPTQTLYKITTDGSAADKEALQEGAQYRLRIGAPDADDYVTAITSIPTKPEIRGDLLIVSGGGTSRCLPIIFLDRRYIVEFLRGTGHAFELRVFFTFAENGQEQTVRWGPTDLFETPKSCPNPGSSRLCYGFTEKQLPGFWSQYMDDENALYTYNRSDSCVPDPALEDSLPKSLCFEVTSVDEYLRNYMTVNNPKFTDLTGAKPEYTNVTGNIEAIGVFGSINTDRKYAILNPCSEALLRLNDTPAPPGCEW